jgi:ArsR family transcriptional regulator, arsenate/arsenite/antimonite-responsive transcriptional repressor
MATKKNSEQVAKFADMFSAMGTEARLPVMQLLWSAHPDGMVVGELQEELDVPNSTLRTTCLRYTALQEVLQFLYAECCTRNKMIQARKVVSIPTCR